jgi:hypothetical protein
MELLLRRHATCKFTFSIENPFLPSCSRIPPSPPSLCRGEGPHNDTYLFQRPDDYSLTVTYLRRIPPPFRSPWPARISNNWRQY